MKNVYLVDAFRTPQAKAGLDLSEVPVPYLGVAPVRKIINKNSLPSDCVDEVIFGNTGNPAKYPNIGRVIALESGLHKTTSGYTVHRNCASGMEALSQAYIKVASGRSDVIIAGGVESMSQMPLLYNKEMTEFFMNLMKAKTLGDRLSLVKTFRFPYLKPIIAIEQGLTDPFCGMNMGQTAEVLARELGITREQQDEYANRSHHKAVSAQAEGRFDGEIVPVHTGKGLSKVLDKDVGPRAQSSMESLAKLKPFFDRRSGTVTVGNSCPITDGGSACLFVSEEALSKYNLTPMARVVDYHFAGLEPERMGIGPLPAMYGALKRANLNMSDMDLVEINEAFAAQVIAVKMAALDTKISSRFGVDELMGEISDDKLNVNGGAIALGHPVGSTGCRLVVTLAHALKQKKGKYGIASLCIGGGQGGAMILENL